MKIEYEYIHFKIARCLPKTRVWNCRGNHGDNLLGEVKWYAGWRQYCFFPAPSTVFNKGCLEDINSFINQCMEQRKNKGGQ